MLQFQCQVTLCLKLDGGCLGITPPKCQETKLHHLHNNATNQGLKRSRLASKRQIRSKNFETKDQIFTPLDVFTKQIMILDEHFSDLIDCDNSEAASNNTYLQKNKNLEIWMKNILTPVFASITILNILISSVAVLFCTINRRNMYKVTYND